MRTLRNILLGWVMGSLRPSLLRKDGPWLRRRKEKKVVQKEEKKKEGKDIKKVMCKDKFSSLICRAPSLRTGKKTPFFKSPEFCGSLQCCSGSSY